MNKFKFLNFKILSLILGVILILILSINFFQKIKGKSSAQIFKSEEFIEEIIEKKIAVAKEIYPLFECPCCGKSIDECTCGMAKERKNYIDVLIEVGENMSENEIILAYVKKYGLNSFMDENKGEEFREKLVKEAPADRPIVSLNPDVYDFEDVSQKKGTVTTFFEIKNNGKSNLVIDKLETSCGCTSASIVYQDEEGPKFNMPGHGINEEIENWQISIAPGATAQLKIYYDPDMHKDFRGAATRDIYIYSNDPIDFQKKATIELNQVD